MSKFLISGLVAAMAATAAGAMQPDQPASAKMQLAQAAPVEIQANPRGSLAAAVDTPNPATANSPVAPALPDDPNYHAGPYVGALTPPPPEAFNKHYAVCRGSLQDNCRNPGGI